MVRLNITLPDDLGKELKRFQIGAVLFPRC